MVPQAREAYESVRPHLAVAPSATDAQAWPDIYSNQPSWKMGVGLTTQRGAN
jgi:hypothetical protein